ncbi:hypothetical protein ARTHRO9V_160128 [Arthrobacter sp. 9V]|nr:hypothetical protein ARTHRO9V_160128 [Arthrobacter sp. 9V]
MVGLHLFMGRRTERNMTSRSGVKVPGFDSLLGFRGLIEESFVRPKGVWTLSTLKSPLLGLIIAIRYPLFGLHLLLHLSTIAT